MYGQTNVSSLSYFHTLAEYGEDGLKGNRIQRVPGNVGRYEGGTILARCSLILNTTEPLGIVHQSELFYFRYMHKRLAFMDIPLPLKSVGSYKVDNDASACT